MTASYFVARLHVSATNREVIEYLYSLLSEEGKAPHNRKARKELYLSGIKAHERNKIMYDYVRGTVI